MAGRIPEAFIKDLLDRTDIVELIGARLELKRAGKEFRARSPFTNEKTPSFFVSPAKQMFFDFSSGKNGTAISFLMEYDRLGFVEAVEELARLAGLEVPREGGGVAEKLVLDGPLDALAAAERFFREKLRPHQPAIDYLKKRGITGDTAKRFGIGYAPDSWDALTRQFQDPAHAIAAGLLIQKDNAGPPDASRPGNRCYDRFRNRIMFPIRDTRGRVIAFGGRTLADDPAKYLNSPETALFHKGRNLYGLYEARQASNNLPDLLVVEGYMDAVMLAQHGVSGVVATLGTATTREHLNLLFKSTSRVVFCFDGDRAGRAAAWRALEQALPEVYEGRECRFMFLPEGHDPDTWIQEIGAGEFRDRVEREARPLSAYLVDELERQAGPATVEGRARLAALAQTHLARLREGPLRALILDELVKRTRLTRADLEGAAKGAAAMPAPAGEPDVAARPFRRALRLLLEQPRLADSVFEVATLAAPPPAAAALADAIAFFRADPRATAGQLAECWRESPRGAALQRLAAEPLAMDDAGIAAAFREEIQRLTAATTQDRLRQRVSELLRLSEQGALTPVQRAEVETVQRQLVDSKPDPAGRRDP